MATVFDNTEYQIVNLLHSVTRYLFHGRRTDTGDWVEGYYSTKVYSEGTIEEYWAHIIKDIKTGIEYEVHENTVSIYLDIDDHNGNKVFLHDIVLINPISKEAGIIYYDTNEKAIFIWLDSGYSVRFRLTGLPLFKVGSAHDLNDEQIEQVKLGKKKFIELFKI